MFVFVTFAMLVVLVATHPAYPPSGTGDHGAMAFIFTAALLGVISLFIGLLSLAGFFNRVADMGPKRRFLRYTSPCVDFIFFVMAPFAMWVSKNTLLCVTIHYSKPPSSRPLPLS